MVTDEIKYLSPDEEDRSFIAQASETVKKGKFVNKLIRSRNGVDFPISNENDIDYVIYWANKYFADNSWVRKFQEKKFLPL